MFLLSDVQNEAILQDFLQERNLLLFSFLYYMLLYSTSLYYMLLYSALLYYLLLYYSLFS